MLLLQLGEDRARFLVACFALPSGAASVNVGQLWHKLTILSNGPIVKSKGGPVWQSIAKLWHERFERLEKTAA